MDDEPIEDSIVVAYRTDIPYDEASSESLDEEQYDDEDTAAFQDMSSEEPSNVDPNIQETREPGAAIQDQAQLRNDVDDSPDRTDEEDPDEDPDEEDPDDKFNALSGGAAAPKARFNMSPRQTRRPQVSHHDYLIHGS